MSVTMMKLSLISFMATIFWLSTGNNADKAAFRDVCVDKHNYYRGKHGVPDLKLNESMNQMSQKWADSLASRGAFEHSHTPHYGENLYLASFSNSDSTLDGPEAVKAWYAEVSKYTDYDTEPSSSDISSFGHFTQMIWKSSQYVSVAMARNYTSSGWVKYYIVCNYYPAGNVIGAFTKNVLKPSDDDS